MTPTSRLRPRRCRAALTVLALAGALAACAPEPATPAAPPGMPEAPAPQTPVGPGTAPAGHVVRVGLTEWSIEIAEDVFPAGTFQVVVTNTGATGHDFVVRGEAGVWGTPVIPPGESAELEITTVAGETLETVCTVTGHHTAGMHRLVEVAGP